MSNKGSYNINKLISFTETNNISLLGEYNKITRDTIISGICKRDDCTNYFTPFYISNADYKKYLYYIIL